MCTVSAKTFLGYFTVLLALFGNAAAEPVATVWTEDGRPGMEAVSGLLSESGFAARQVDGEGLPEALSKAQKPDVLVLPHGGDYPARASEALNAFLESGGALVVLGGIPLQRALLETKGGGMLPIEAGRGEVVALPLDKPWRGGHAQPGVSLDMTPEAASSPARFVARDFQGYCYAGTNLPNLEFPDGVIAFEARDTGDLPRLCVELKAKDGSRWKSIIELDVEWREYRIHTGDFVSYNNEERGKDGDFCRADEIQSVAFGFTSAMVGTGTCSFEMRALRIEQAVFRGAEVRATRRFKPASCSVRRWFGDPVGPERFIPVPYGRSAGFKGHLLDGERVEPETWAAVAFATPLFEPVGYHLEERFTNVSRTIAETLLTMKTMDGATCPVAGFAAFSGGPMPGGRHLFFGLPLDALSASPTAREGFARGLTLVREAVVLASVEPVFRAKEGQVDMGIRLEVLTPSVLPAGVTLKAQATVLGETSDFTPASLETGVKQGAIPLSANSPTLPWPIEGTRAYTIRAGIDPEAAVYVLGAGEFGLDPLEALRGICEFMDEHFRTHGKLHGNRFLDSRGARALMAAADVFDNPSFRETALAWVDGKVVGDQREDGGYRMGYGVGKKGEECYVADGGEIAVCVAQAACHAQGVRRQAYLQSLDAYISYRESFRVETGGIGVGWCLRDYSKRPIVPLDRPTRILAPERNTYTIGCTLASAYAHAALRQDAELERRAERDADWLMQRAERLNGAYAESYVYAHALTSDPGRKRAYEDYLRRTLRDPTVDKLDKDWWLTGGGRTALNLFALAYWSQEIAPNDAEAKAAVLQAVARMFSPDSPQSIPSIIASRHALGHDEWIYICYGTVSLAEMFSGMDELRVVAGTP